MKGDIFQYPVCRIMCGRRIFIFARYMEVEYRGKQIELQSYNVGTEDHIKSSLLNWKKPRLWAAGVRISTLS